MAGVTDKLRDPVGRSSLLRLAVPSASGAIGAVVALVWMQSIAPLPLLPLFAAGVVAGLFGRSVAGLVAFWLVGGVAALIATLLLSILTAGEWGMALIGVVVQLPLVGSVGFLAGWLATRLLDALMAPRR
jgi:hypothetical protein